MTEEINLQDLENKIQTKGKYLTEFLNPLIVKKIENHFACKKDSTVKIIKYDAGVELEQTKIYLIDEKQNDEFEVIDYSNIDETFKIQILKFSPNKFARKLFHKDYLGMIIGKEGTQAVRSSDYSIGKFRFLEKLILFYGRNGYMKIAKYISYYFES